MFSTTNPSTPLSESQLQKEKELRVAASAGDIEKVRELYAEGVDINAAGPGSRKSALHWAVQNKHLVLVERLVGWGAKVNMQDSDGNTPLHLVFVSTHYLLSERIQMALYLQKQQANPIYQNRAKVTPMIEICKIRDSVELHSKPHLCAAVSSFIVAAKYQIAEIARSGRHSASIRENGAVEFYDSAHALMDNFQWSELPAGLRVNVNVMDGESKDPIRLAPL